MWLLFYIKLKDCLKGYECKWLKKIILFADMVIDTLKNNNVDYVFGIPGAKIDYLFDALEDDGPELIVTRHEQNRL